MARIEVALCLPNPDIEALTQGRIIVATPRLFIRPGRQFALCPSHALTPLPVEQAYCSSFLHIAKQSLDSSQAEKFLIKAWARCEMCQEYRDSESLNILSKLTIWTSELLQKALAVNEKIFLSYLRVYLLDEPIEVTTRDEDRAKTFIPLSNYWITTERAPVLNDAIFLERKRHLENLKAPHHPELEDLYKATTKLTTSNSEAKEFARDIEVFLGWANGSQAIQPDSDMTWIKSIANVGNSSDGDLFEKLVRKSLVKLGFKNSNANPQASLDPDGCGGAGGLDFYCEEPYLVVGECKATKTESVPDGTPAQLVKLGLRHLENYDKCIKIIMAGGALNAHAKQTAVGNKMNVIRPETLQRLVELKKKHQGSINLMELKPCLESAPFGEDADIKVNGYIDKIWNGIKVRSHIIKAVKQLIEIEPDRTQFEVVEIRAQYNAAFSRHDGSGLDNQTVHELLIELSSPLAGYLGRVQGTSLQTDRFYFLRDLPMD